jgi:hypothetical protein
MFSGSHRILVAAVGTALVAASALALAPSAAAAGYTSYSVDCDTQYNGGANPSVVDTIDVNPGDTLEVFVTNCGAVATNPIAGVAPSVTFNNVTRSYTFDIDPAAADGTYGGTVGSTTGWAFAGQATTAPSWSYYLTLRVSTTSTPSGGSTAVVAYQGPADILQQIPREFSDKCDSVNRPELDWANVSSGGWSPSWSMWANSGKGGYVCTRTLTYRSHQWTVTP